jgi:hypothetical protein
MRKAQRVNPRQSAAIFREITPKTPHAPHIVITDAHQRQ